MRSILQKMKSFRSFLLGMGIFLFLLACTGPGGQGAGTPMGLGGNPMSGGTHEGGVSAPVTDNTRQHNCYEGFTNAKISAASFDPHQIPVMNKPVKVRLSGQLLTNCMVVNGPSLGGRYVRILDETLNSNGTPKSYNVYLDSPLQFSEDQGNTFEAVIDILPASMDYLNTVASHLEIFLVPEGFSGISTEQKSCSNAFHCFDEAEEWTSLTVF
ncbi:MAG: hypothetical protein U1F57_01745 [bacterium]